VLDEADPVWSELSVWQDANQDGLTDAGELRSLGAEGIRSLSLVSDWATREDPGGNLVHGETTFEREDGTRGVAADVSLAYETLLGPAVPILAEEAVRSDERAATGASDPPAPPQATAALGEAGALPRRALAEWVEPGPQLVLQIIADMATQLAPPGETLVSVVPEPIPIAPGAIEDSPFG
jgi:hypothetical protein